MTNNNTSTRRERPIIFSAPMIRAILDGRKTQTRRIAKLTDAGHFLACRYGISGDRLWVRETWRPAAEFLSEGVGAKDIRYAASVREADYGLWKWRSPIFMPRRASRITLEITGVRIERLHAITSEDAESEGVQCDRS